MTYNKSSSKQFMIAWGVFIVNLQGKIILEKSIVHKLCTYHFRILNVPGQDDSAIYHVHMYVQITY